jgi:hypothetical protein
MDKVTLLNLLQMYETAIASLEETRDPAVVGLIRRFQRHRADVITALAGAV